MQKTTTPRTLAVCTFPESLDALKRPALIFNSICLVPAPSMLRRYPRDVDPFDHFIVSRAITRRGLGRRARAELDWLEENNVLYTPRMHSVKGTFADQLHRMFWPEGGGLVPRPEFAHDTIGDFACRITSACVHPSEKLEVIPLVHSANVICGNEISSDQIGASKRAEVIEIVVRAFPQPDELTPWEQIIDFRSDPDSEAKVKGLRVWINDMGRKALSSAELRDELEWALQEYEQHIKLHRIKNRQGVLKVIVIGAAQAIENVLKLKLKDTAELLFTANNRRAQMLEAEQTAPGRELAYIYSARKKFVRH